MQMQDLEGPHGQGLRRQRRAVEPVRMPIESPQIGQPPGASLEESGQQRQTRDGSGLHHLPEEHIDPDRLEASCVAHVELQPSGENPAVKVPGRGRAGGGVVVGTQGADSRPAGDVGGFRLVFGGRRRRRQICRLRYSPNR